MRKEKISVIIPAYNEEDNIINTISETIRVLENINDDYEIIVIDDGSTDNTYINVKSKITDFKNKAGN